MSDEDAVRQTKLHVEKGTLHSHAEIVQRHQHQSMHLQLWKHCGPKAPFWPTGRRRSLKPDRRLKWELVQSGGEMRLEGNDVLQLMSDISLVSADRIWQPIGAILEVFWTKSPWCCVLMVDIALTCDSKTQT